LFPLNFYMCF